MCFVVNPLKTDILLVTLYLSYIYNTSSFYARPSKDHYTSLTDLYGIDQGSRVEHGTVEVMAAGCNLEQATIRLLGVRLLTSLAAVRPWLSD